jgi:hypothetical protein
MHRLRDQAHAGYDAPGNDTNHCGSEYETEFTAAGERPQTGWLKKYRKDTKAAYYEFAGHAALVLRDCLMQQELYASAHAVKIL